MNKAGRVAVLVLVVTAAGSFAGKGGASIPPSHDPLSPEAIQVLSWLPLDTETLITARGPFPIPGPRTDDRDTENQKMEARDLREFFQSSALGPLGLNNGGLQKHLMSARVRFTAEGSKAFRSPHGLGELPYEGCTIIMFAEDVAGRESGFMEDAANSGARVEDIANHKVAIFQQVMERDTWTTFVTFPLKNIVVIATNREYLREVLARMSAPKADRAFPETLQEWKYVDTRAEFWGMRHFDKSQASTDPTSPFGGRKAANLPDERAIGLTFQCDPARELRAKLVYLTGDKAKAMEIEHQRFPPDAEVESTAGLHIMYRDLSPGVIESSYDLSRSRSLDWFFF